MAGNTVTLEFAGDAAKLQRAAKEARDSVDSVGQASRDAGAGMDAGAADATRFERRMGDLGAATTGLTDAVDTLGGGMQAVADIQDYARAKAARLARAQNDVEQAMADGRQAVIDREQAQRDLNQTQQDGVQAHLDIQQSNVDFEQATLDAKIAQEEFNAAVKEYGVDSDEATQASINLSQANQDVRQADADLTQARLDQAQATTDAKQATEDASQANIDAKAAQLDLNDAMHEANPPALQEWADKINMVTPLLTAIIGVTSLVTAAQWAWNAAQMASPTTWIVVGIIALIGVIALLVIKWDWVKEKGAAAWKWIKNAASDAWEWMRKLPGKIGDAFASVGNAIARPFISAFNRVSDAWNNTVGGLSWSVPGWIPGIGGNTISAPRLPKFHTGGQVPGMPGQQVPILALAGETVLPAGRTGHGEAVTVQVFLDSDVLIDATAAGVSRRGGNVQLVLGGRNAA
jgi:hypothetical protein